jgi:hypothetical protein
MAKNPSLPIRIMIVARCGRHDMRVSFQAARREQSSLLREPTGAAWIANEAFYVDDGVNDWTWANWRAPETLGSTRRPAGSFWTRKKQ